MKTLLFFKRFDLALQICALIVPALLAWRGGQYFSLFYMYFFVGGAQVVSFIVHAIAGRQTWTSIDRRSYGKMLAVLIGGGVVMVLCYYFLQGLVVLMYLVLLSCFLYFIATPIVAVWYFKLCLRETTRVARAGAREMLIVRSV